MPRLIDADALEKRHCENCGEIAIEICKNDPVCATLMWVREEETIDPESLRPRGRWIPECDERQDYSTGEYEEDYYIKCSVCGRIEWDVNQIDAMFDDWGKIFEKYPYCHCGAKMDLEEDND